MQQTLGTEFHDDRSYTVEEFLAAYEGREGRYELIDGKVHKMPAELNSHVYIKGRLFFLLTQAIEAQGAPYLALTDGAGLKIRFDRAREPDLTVSPIASVDWGSMLLPEPAVIAEVVSPTSGRTDRTVKLQEYFGFTSLKHYLVIDDGPCTVEHSFRGVDGTVHRVILADGELSLELPDAGPLVIPLAALWPPKRFAP